MEYLVTMTTHVPDGTPEQAVADIKAREAARSAELAAQGHLLRLWRPPLRPGEWRTFGLFAAADSDDLANVLQSMPLRVWRTDEVKPLAPHPNDPGSLGRAPLADEYLITMTIRIPAGTPDATVAESRKREADRARELAGQGHLMRLWIVGAGPGEGGTLGLWSADDGAGLAAVLESLPLFGWMTAETTHLSSHPSDPALVKL
jgi:muconolactone delta-isomerase